MKTFLVCWEIQLDAETAREAAEKALEIQRDPSSIATVFDVWAEDEEHDYYRIDLSKEETEG